MARLGERHRVTVDVDTVYLGAGGGAGLGRTLIAAGGVPMGDGVEFHGVEVDTIEVTEMPEARLPDDLYLRSFVLAHRWALDTATRMRIVVAPADGAPAASTVIATATAPALIATKLSSFPTRREGNRQHKQISDLHDLYRLLTAADVGSLRDAYAHSPFDLAAISHTLGRGMIEERAADTIRAMRLGSDSMSGVVLDDFASALDTLFVAVADLI
jgi:hypothetical protein